MLQRNSSVTSGLIADTVWACWQGGWHVFSCETVWHSFYSCSTWSCQNPRWQSRKTLPECVYIFYTRIKCKKQCSFLGFYRHDQAYFWTSGSCRWDTAVFGGRNFFFFFAVLATEYFFSIPHHTLLRRSPQLVLQDYNIFKFMLFFADPWC